MGASDPDFGTWESKTQSPKSSGQSTSCLPRSFGWVSTVSRVLDRGILAHLDGAQRAENYGPPNILDGKGSYGQRTRHKFLRCFVFSVTSRHRFNDPSALYQIRIIILILYIFFLLSVSNRLRKSSSLIRQIAIWLFTGFRCDNLPRIQVSTFRS